jgi:hypothetical protein
MKLCFLVLFGGASLVASFPTAENVANLARAGGLELPQDLSLADIVQYVKRDNEKRLLFNPLVDPVTGQCRYGSLASHELTSLQSQASMNGRRQTLHQEPSEDLVGSPNSHGKTYVNDWSRSRTQRPGKPWLY